MVAFFKKTSILWIQHIIYWACVHVIVKYKILKFYDAYYNSQIITFYALNNLYISLKILQYEKGSIHNKYLEQEVES